MRLRIQRDESLRSYVARSLFLSFGEHELLSLKGKDISSEDVRKLASYLGLPGCEGFNKLLHEHTTYPIISVFKDDYDISYSGSAYLKDTYVIESTSTLYSFCPDCLHEDLSLLGYSYWRRSACDDAKICYKHLVELISHCPICNLEFSDENHKLDVLWAGCEGKSIVKGIGVASVDSRIIKKAKIREELYRCSFHIPIELTITILINRLRLLKVAGLEYSENYQQDLEWLIMRLRSWNDLKLTKNGMQINTFSYAYLDIVVAAYPCLQDFLDEVKKYKTNLRPIDSLWSIYQCGGFESPNFIEEDYQQHVGHWSCPYPSQQSLDKCSMDTMIRSKNVLYACCNFTFPGNRRVVR